MVVVPPVGGHHDFLTAHAVPGLVLDRDVGVKVQEAVEEAKVMELVEVRWCTESQRDQEEPHQ